MSTNALADESSPVPTGWLAQVRRLRNQVAHQDSLARVHSVGGPTMVRALGSRGHQADDYLATACDRVHGLTEQMIGLAIHLSAHEQHAGWDRPRWFPMGE